MKERALIQRGIKYAISMSFAPLHRETLTEIKNDSATAIPGAEISVASLMESRRSTAKQPAMRNGRFKKDFPIIVHCHLCWDWVWQRPQQFLSRLSKTHKILFVETVGPDDKLAAPMATFRVPEQFPNITILRVQFPVWQWHDGARVDRERRRLVQEFLDGPLQGHFQDAVQWFYDPMAVTAFAGRMGEVMTVYDCMDELSKFKGAPPEIVKRERELLACAEVVFTGGRKLLESKSRFHGNCHFYGCGVDWEHFGKARQAETVIPEDVSRLPKPVYGFFGVVDERMDYDLVARLADANPDGSVVVVGPAIKVDPKQFPQRPNLHWLGGRSYDVLPAYCKAFDVCIMPFALNEATEFINPTKALEYMATGRPVVSTPVADVVRNFGSVVKIGRTPEEFLALCRAAYDEPDHVAISGGLEMARNSSWDSIVAQLESRIEEAYYQQHDLVTT